MLGKDLLKKYFEGDLNREEMVLLMEYLESGAEKVDKELLNRVWEESRSRKYFSDEKSAKLLKQIKRRLEKEKITLRRFPYHKNWLRGVAVISGLLLVSIILLHFLSVGKKQEFTTSYGETKSIVLPDGTEVTLNANSSIYFYPKWNSDSFFPESQPEKITRQVWLVGEAFFKVMSLETKQKFIVHTEEMEVEVLGTAFNVNNRRNKTQVVLNSGRIKLNLKNKEPQEIIMQPGELGEYSEKERRLVLETVDTKIYTSWKNKMLVFDDTPIHKIAQMLEDIYGYNVVFSDSKLGDLVFSASVPSDDLETLLALLARSCNVKIEKDEKKLRIKDNN